MRDIPTKADGSSTLNAGEFNSNQVEKETAVTSSGQTLNPSAGPDSNQDQLARAITLGGLGAISYQDTGSANTFVLGAVTGFVQPTAYFDGMTVCFQVANTNTGACTINVETIGAVDFTQAGGVPFTAGLIAAGNLILARYFSGDNRFEQIANTTPPITGPDAPNQIAVYSDDGSVSQNTLTIVSGFNLPAAFTDQMTILFRANATNDGNGTHQVNIAPLGTKDIVETDNSNPIAGRMPAGAWVLAIFREVRDKFEIAFVYDRPQPSVIMPVTVSSSSGTAYNLATLAQTRAPTAYIDGMIVVFRAPQSNSGSLDIQVNSLGLRDLRKTNGTNFVSGEIQSGDMITAQYILSEDRFRGFAGGQVAENLRTGRSIRYESINGGQIPAGGGALSWGNIAFDDLSFNSGGNPTIPAGQRIERVDVNVFLNTVLSSGDDVSYVIQKNTVVIGGGVLVQGSASNTQTITLIDVPVSDGDDFQIVSDLDSGSSKNVTGSFTLRVSKFGDP